MGIFSRSRKNEFFSPDEQYAVIEAIRNAEKRTSGEIRVFIESRCRFVDPLDRASELFWTLKMDHTADRNAVLVYVAMKDHQFAIYADRNIHNKVGQEFWYREVSAMAQHFRENHYRDALIHVIDDIGDALKEHFPYDDKGDKNELPDDIIFGR